MTGQQGYTLVEMLVAMAVTSIVLAGTYAAYGFFARQQQLVLSQTELSRNAMRAVDLMQSDIRQAGYRDYTDPDVMQAGQPIVIARNAPGDLRLVYDEVDAGGTVQRMLTRYYTKTYTAAESGVARDRILRQVRRCNDASVFCDTANSKGAGTFKDQFQTLSIRLTLKSPRKLEGAVKDTTKNFSFIARAKNVSLVP